jgi:hypothetical protein
MSNFSGSDFKLSNVALNALNVALNDAYVLLFRTFCWFPCM